MAKDFTGQDAQNFVNADNAVNIKTNRRHEKEIGLLQRLIMKKSKNDPSPSPSGQAIKTSVNVKLTASGDTVTAAAAESKVFAFYSPDLGGFIPKTLENNITHSSAGATSGRKYDFFLYWDESIGDAVLDKVIWTNATTRSVALTAQDGAQLLSTDPTWRYVGWAYYNGTSMLVSSADGVNMQYQGTGDATNPTGADPFTGTIEDTSGVSGYSGGVLQFLLSSITGAFLGLAGGIVIDASGFLLKLVGGSTYISFTSTRALFGSDISAANTTAFAIFFTTQTYNTETMEAGSVLFGSNSASYANVLWRPSTKQLQFRSATTVQAYVDTTGAISFGAGKGTLDATGEKLNAPAYTGTVADAVIQWIASDNSSILARLIGTYGGAVVNSGAILYGRGHDVSLRGFVALFAEDYLGVLKSSLVVDTNGTSTLDLSAVIGAVGAQFFNIKTKTSGTNAGNNALVLDTDSSGTPAAGLGSAILFRIKNSTGVMQTAGYALWKWITTTNGAEDGQIDLATQVAGTDTVIGSFSKNGLAINGPIAATGAITGSNLSGTNTGDATSAPFTPVVGGTGTMGTATYTTQLGAGYVMGKVFFYEISLTWTAISGSPTGNLVVDGLPYTAANNGIAVSSAVGFSNITLAAIGNKLQPAVQPNTTTILFTEVGSGAQSAVGVDTAGTLRLSGWYITT